MDKDKRRDLRRLLDELLTEQVAAEQPVPAIEIMRGALEKVFRASKVAARALKVAEQELEGQPEVVEKIQAARDSLEVIRTASLPYAKQEREEEA